MEVLAGLQLADESAPYGGFVVKLNHRRLLDAMLAVAGVPPQKFRCSAGVCYAHGYHTHSDAAAVPTGAWSIGYRRKRCPQMWAVCRGARSGR